MKTGITENGVLGTAFSSYATISQQLQELRKKIDEIERQPKNQEYLLQAQGYGDDLHENYKSLQVAIERMRENQYIEAWYQLLENGRSMQRANLSLTQIVLLWFIILALTYQVSTNEPIFLAVIAVCCFILLQYAKKSFNGHFLELQSNLNVIGNKLEKLNQAQQNHTLLAMTTLENTNDTLTVCLQEKPIIKTDLLIEGVIRIHQTEARFQQSSCDNLTFLLGWVVFLIFILIWKFSDKYFSSEFDNVCSPRM